MLLSDWVNELNIKFGLHLGCKSPVDVIRKYSCYLVERKV